MSNNMINNNRITKKYKENILYLKKILKFQYRYKNIIEKRLVMICIIYIINKGNLGNLA